MSNGSATKRLTYGANKYAAFHLLLCRWLRRYAQPVPYQYVTLGGTEFGDVRSLHFIDPTLLGHALSFEEKPNRFELAEATAESLRQAGVDIVVIDGNLFSSFARESADPNIFFVDLEGSCAFGELHKSFGALFR